MTELDFQVFLAQAGARVDCILFFNRDATDEELAKVEARVREAYKEKGVK